MTKNAEGQLTPPISYEGQPISAIVLWRSFLLLVLGAVFYWASFPPLEWSPLGWLVPVTWLGALDGLRAKHRFYAMGFAGFLSASFLLFWLWTEFESFALIPWVLVGIYFGVWGAIARLGPGWPTWLVMLWPAVAWTALEYARAELTPMRFAWMTLGYSQQNALGSSLAPWVGVYGVSFLIVLVGTIYMMALKNWKRSHALRVAGPGMIGGGVGAGSAADPAMAGGAAGDGAIAAI